MKRAGTEDLRKTARDLGISVKTLYARLRDYEAAANQEAPA